MVAWLSSAGWMQANGGATSAHARRHPRGRASWGCAAVLLDSADLKVADQAFVACADPPSGAYHRADAIARAVSCLIAVRLATARVVEQRLVDVQARVECVPLHDEAEA